MVCLGQNKCPFPCMGVIAILGQSLFSKKYQSGSRNAWEKKEVGSANSKKSSDKNLEQKKKSHNNIPLQITVIFLVNIIWNVNF